MTNYPDRIKAMSQWIGSFLCPWVGSESDDQTRDNQDISNDQGTPPYTLNSTYTLYTCDDANFEFAQMESNNRIAMKYYSPSRPSGNG